MRALTGVDADRLPEEKARGITIDLGFAALDLGDLQLNFVDVPGHEKFVKNMLAGASGIDVVALVVAADAGVMPQTREHFEICRLLAVKSGLIVITKIDLVDDELLELVKLDVAELVEHSFLENAPVVAVSAKTGENIVELKETLRRVAAQIPARLDEKIALLPVDRVFSVKGFGAVVTGTLGSGEIAENTELEILPQRKKVRIRGVQTHGKKVVKAVAGQRAALNLGGVETAEIARGDVLAPPRSLRPTQIVDVEIEVLAAAAKSLKSRQRVRFHVGTVEALARIQIIGESNEIAAGKTGFAQIRLEIPIVAPFGERFILRSYSPQRTIAGGKILNNSAVKHRRKDFSEIVSRLATLNSNDKAAQIRVFLEIAAESGLTIEDLTARTAWRGDILTANLSELILKKAVIQTENIFLARAAFEHLGEKTLAEIKNHHRIEPLSRGLGRETLREKVFAHLAPEIFRAILAELERRAQILIDKDVIRAGSYRLQLDKSDQILLEKFEKIYAAAKLEVPTLEAAIAAVIAGTTATRDKARKIFQLLIDNGELVRVTPEFYFRQTDLTELLEKLRQFAANNSPDKTFDVAQFKDLAQISRKYAIPLLEYFDQTKRTRRVGEKRMILD